jgi:hypothetical protein
MKVLNSIALIAMLALGLTVGCGDDDAKSNNGSANNVSTNNTMANNTSTNGSTNNMSTNNMSTNNMSTNNMSTNNNGGCQVIDPAIGPCDPLCQTGCEAGQACVAGSTGPGAPTSSACQPAGTAMEGDTCSGMAACAAGLNCIVTAQGQMMGECAQFCRVGGGEPSCMDGTCVVFDQNLPTLGVCQPSCTGFPNDTCDAGQQCYPADQMGGTVCGTPGATAIGGQCTNLNECVAGSICFNGTCVSQCDTANPTCGQGEACTTITPGFAGCVASCTTFPNDDCPAGQMCYPTPEGGTACATFNANASAGDACQFLNECNDEQACVGGMCANLCATAGDNSDCGANEQCVQLQGAPFNACVAM